MKKIVPFKKEIIFKTNLSEITSISLEHTLHVDGHDITGEFIISGDYKMADTSIDTELFSFDLPFDISMDDHYDMGRVNIDIDDFYYEIINNNRLAISIDVLVDRLEEKPLFIKEEPVITEEPILEEELIRTLPEGLEEEMEEKEEVEEREEVEVHEEVEEREEVVFPFLDTSEPTKLDIRPKEETMVEEKNPLVAAEQVKSLFDNLDNNSETYITYKVCIIREGDTLEGIMQRYGMARELLEDYNDLTEIRIGDKLIIPAAYDAKV